MSSDTKFDELFALRVLLQDEFENEYDIIRELKYNLIQQGMDIENISNYLKEFYEAFDINITIEQINEILEPNAEDNLNTQMINIINQIINSQINNNQLNVIEEDNEENNEENNEEYNEEYNEENNNEEENNEENNKENNEENNEEYNEEYNEENNEENNNEDNNNEDNIQDISSNIINNSISFPINNIQGISQLQIYISQIGSGEHIQYNANLSPLNINNLIGNLLNSSIGLGSINSMTQDVVSTLDDSETDKLKKYKLSENKEEKCSVCMTSLNIDEHVCELPCEHIFHDECIQPWLQQYNYKCPICRKEVGKPKHNI